VHNKSFWQEKSVFWANIFLGALFTKDKYALLNQIKKTDFLIPYSTYSKKNFFFFHGTANCTFYLAQSAGFLAQSAGFLAQSVGILA
jgi:hypothetical protein